MQQRNLGYLLAAVAGCLSSTLGVLGKAAYALGVDPLSLISLRATIATAIIGVILAAVKPNLLRLRSVDLPFFLGYGFVGVAVNYAGYFYALKFTTVATAITSLYTYPAIVVILAFAIYREPITCTKSVALLSSFLGVVLVALGSSPIVVNGDVRGIGFGLLGGAGTAVYVLAGKGALAKYDAKTALFYSFLSGSLALDALRVSQLGFTLNLNWSIIFVVLAIATVPTVLGYGTLTYSLRFIEAGRASLASSIEPAIAIYLAYLFLNEAPNPTQLAGSALIVASVVLLQLRNESYPKMRVAR
jgi:drug/metabolite transporter (DMT)-like permease